MPALGCPSCGLDFTSFDEVTTHFREDPRHRVEVGDLRTDDAVVKLLGNEGRQG